MPSPLETAREAVRIASEAVNKARNYYDWQDKGSDTSIVLVKVADDLIDAQQRLGALVND